MDKKTEAAEAYIEARNFPLTAAIARSAFEAGWDAGRVSMLDTLSEAVNAGVPQEAPAQVPVWKVGDTIREANDLRTLPVGTILEDVEGDYHKHTEAGVWQFTVNGEHTGTRRAVENAFVLGYLPATVDFLPGGEPQVGDLVRSRLGAVGEYNESGLHDGCHSFTGRLVEAYSKGMYNNGYHIGPLSDFEKVSD